MGHRLRIGLAGIASLGLLALGCHHNAPSTAANSAPLPEGVAPPSPSAAASTAPAPKDGILSQDVAALNSHGYLKDAFFDFNAATLRADARTALADDARWLEKYPSVRIMVEGHCDDRGTEEYNLALGDKRDGAVREYLAEMGVSRARIQTVSYGKDRPFCSGDNELCRQDNRRGHFVITAK